MSMGGQIAQLHAMISFEPPLLLEALMQILSAFTICTTICGNGPQIVKTTPMPELQQMAPPGLLETAVDELPEAVHGEAML
jgi:hypothetical protein